ncbi:MAG: aldehyde ferredoxin oxidoreductase C-terminal domain-containing protein [Actinomycetota bacterium]
MRGEALENIKRSVLAEGLSLYGTSGGVELSSAICDLPVKNWREAQWKEGMENLSGVTMARTISKKSRSCYACPIACKRVVEIEGGEYAMEEGPGPEYEGVGALGFMPRIDNLRAVMKANALCNAYGLDAISTGGTIAYAIEAFQEGLIGEKDTDGMILDWNRPDQLVEMVRKIAVREGFGDELAEGCRVLSRRYGGEELAIHVKGMECPMHDPRSLWSMALGYATSIRGACHNRDTNLGLEMGMDTLEEIGFPRTRPQSSEGKAMQTAHAQTLASIVDSAVICVFAWKGAGSSLGILRDMLNAVTAYGYGNEELLEAGRRIWYLKRALGNLCGITRQEDRIPDRIINPHLEGLSSGLLRVLNPLIRINEKIADMIRSEKFLDYYRQLHARVILPNTFRTVNLTGKLIPPAALRGRRSGGAGAGAAPGSSVDFDAMLDEYYRLRGINKRGYPEKEVLDDLGLGEISAELYEAG